MGKITKLNLRIQKSEMYKRPNELDLPNIIIYFCIIIPPIVVGTVQLTKTPPAIIYAFVGETVRFNWDYTVTNKDLDFGYYVSSPIWYYYKPDGERSVIAVEDGLHNWKWKISYLTCPPRLLRPTVRVSKESVATLVISNVTKSDSGWYEIYLALRIAPAITDRVELVVTGNLRQIETILS